MKKVLGIAILSFFLSGNLSFSAEPKWDSTSLNVNIINHGWKIKSSATTHNTGKPVEIFTLVKGNWILKCSIFFEKSGSYGYCTLP